MRDATLEASQNRTANWLRSDGALTISPTECCHPAGVTLNRGGQPVVALRRPPVTSGASPASERQNSDMTGQREARFYFLKLRMTVTRNFIDSAGIFPS